MAKHPKKYYSLFGTLCISVTVLVPPASSSVSYGDCTTTSTACPDKSECVQGSCVACEFDARKCMRSIEKCNTLLKKCSRGDGCYIHDEIDKAAGTVTSKLVCAPNDPCATTTCDDGYCVNTDAGDRPPVAQCRPYNPDIDPCDGKTCSHGNICAVRRGLCGDYSCIVETVCIGNNDCEDCDTFYQFCEISQMVNCIGKGKCSNFKDRWDDEDS